MTNQRWAILLMGMLGGCRTADHAAVADDAGAADGGELAAPDAATPQAALPAADAGASQPEFTYDLTRASSIDVEARAPDAPLPGVLISIRNAPAEGQEVGELLWTGLTDRDGHARGAARTEHVSEVVHVTIHKMGWAGPYTDPALRAQQGILAPSGYVVVAPAALASLRVALAKGAQ
jgi:hypothetical protein